MTTPYLTPAYIDAYINDLPLIIVKATMSEDGVMRWQAVTSDTQPDKSADQTSVDLFRDWVNRVEKGIVTDWLGEEPRVPFLGLSHYPGMGGFGEAGPTERMYIDGDRFKAAGVFYADPDHPLGKALYDAIRVEQLQIKRGATIEQPIRISAGWWDLCHAHGDFIFSRKSLTDQCPICQAQGPTGRRFLKGQLDHFAATRVPMNPRTSIELTEKAMTTRIEDAESILLPEDQKLAGELEKRSKLMVTRGETEAELITKAEDDEEDAEAADMAAAEEEMPDKKRGKMKKADTVRAKMKTVDGEKYPASDFLAVESADSPSTWHLQVSRNGTPDHTLMGAAWAALHEGFRGNKYEGPMKKEALSKLKALYKKEEMALPTQKADLTERPALSEVERMAEGDEERHLPFQGATSIEAAEAVIETGEKMSKMMSNWDIFRTVVSNIMMSRDPELDKVAAMSAAVTEFSDRIDQLKAGLADAYLIQTIGPEVETQADDTQPVPAAPQGQPTQRSEVIMTQQTPSAPEGGAQPTMDAQVQAVITRSDLTRAQKEEEINKLFAGYAQAVQGNLDAANPPNVAEQMKAALSEVLAPLAQQIGLLNTRLAQSAVQPTMVPAGQPQQTLSMPVQKSVSLNDPLPQIVKAETAAGGNGQLPISPVTGKPSPVYAAIRRSVGLVD